MTFRDMFYVSRTDMHMDYLDPIVFRKSDDFL